MRNSLICNISSPAHFFFVSNETINNENANAVKCLADIRLVFNEIKNKIKTCTLNRNGVIITTNGKN